MLFRSGAEHRIRSLIIISGIGLVGTPPEIIQLIAGNTERSPLVRFKNPEVFYYRFLHDIFFDENKITDQLLSALAAPLQYENAYAPLLAAARQFALPESNRLRLDLKLLTLPCLIIWGENDQVTAAATAGLWRSNLKNSTSNTSIFKYSSSSKHRLADFVDTPIRFAASETFTSFHRS